VIRKLKVTGLQKRLPPFDLTFHEDINILTGRNGSGKTTLLKLLWCLLSAKFELIRSEIYFDSAELTTSSFELSIIRKERDARDIRKQVLEITFVSNGNALTKDIPLAALAEPSQRFENRFMQDLRRRITGAEERSVFFPTFRRIEGGFSIDETTHAQMHMARGYYYSAAPLQLALSQLSQSLSTPNHRMVASISTADLVELLTIQYADISERTNRVHVALSEYITDMIRTYERKQDEPQSSQLEAATKSLENIQQKANDTARQRDVLLRPFSVLSGLIGKIFQHKGIRVTEAVTLGEAKEAVSSDWLSAGEKQMLSFLCYNAFTSNGIIFVDEPEISLHADWQRTLFPTLMEQSSGNQFIVATHSPFIYTKYKDKELLLGSDRGDAHGVA